MFDEPLISTRDKYYTMLGGNGMYPRTLILDENGVITFEYTNAVSYETLVSEIEKIKNK